MKKLYNIALFALALLLMVGCEQHFWADDEVIEQTSTISILPSGGSPAYEYTIYPEIRTMMEWGTSSSVTSYNPIYSYIDNSTEEDGVVTKYDIEFVESRYDTDGNETQYHYVINESTPMLSVATRASSGSVDMVVTNITKDIVVASITGAQLTESTGFVTATELSGTEGESYNVSEDVALNERRVTLAVGEPYTLTATIGERVATSSDVTWSSDHEEYVKVSSEGAITAITEGKSNITVTTKDGGYKAICTITVVIKMESITITPLEMELAYGEGVDSAYTTFTVEQTAFTPEDATISATEWKSSDETIATVDENGLVTAVNAGVVEIYAASTDGSGVESEHCKVTVKAAQEVTKIEISGAPDGDTMDKGDKLTLAATVTPDDATNKAVAWSSSDPTTISVSDDGEIEALKAGNATITATAKDGSEIEGSTNEITVVVPITKITLSDYLTELEVEDTDDITMTLDPSDTTDTEVEWNSTYPAVAKVEDGKVTALSVGDTTISVTSKANPDVTASYYLTVNAKTIKVTSVTLSEDQVIKFEENATTTITATVKEDNAADKSLDWKSSDEEIAMVNNGTVTALKAGEVTITATSKDGSEESDTCTILFCSAEIPAELSAPINECTTPISNTTQIILTSVFGSQTPTNASWVSSKTDVAMVDSNGLVTSLTSGTTTITYKATVGGINFEETCEVTVSVKSFPDATFRGLLEGLCDVTSESDGILLTEANQTALNTITTLINANTVGVTDATGIAYLTKLTSFTAASNFKPTTLDLSKNVELTTKVELTGAANSSVLQSIVLGSLTKLKLLTLKNHTNLTSIDISGCSALTTVNVTGCSGLTKIICTQDQKDNITFTGFTANIFEIVTTGN